LIACLGTLFILVTILPGNVPADTGDIFSIEVGRTLEILHGQTIRITVRTPDTNFVENWFGNFSSNVRVVLTFESAHETTLIGNGTAVQFSEDVNFKEQYDINFYNPQSEDRAYINYSIWGTYTDELLTIPPPDFHFTNNPTLTELAGDVQVSFSVNLQPANFVIFEDGYEVASGSITTLDSVYIIWSKSAGECSVELNVTLNSPSFPEHHPVLTWTESYGEGPPADFELTYWVFVANRTHATFAGITSTFPCRVRAYENEILKEEIASTTSTSFTISWSILGHQPGQVVAGRVELTKDAAVLSRAFSFVVPTTTTTTTTTPTTTSTTSTATTTTTTNTDDIFDLEIWGPTMALGAILLLAFIILIYLFVLNEKSKIPKTKSKKPLSITFLLKKEYQSWKKKYLKKLNKPRKGETEVTRMIKADRILFDVVFAPIRGLRKLMSSTKNGLSNLRTKISENRKSKRKKEWVFLPDTEENVEVLEEISEDATEEV
jgi:hypothetical protein